MWHEKQQKRVCLLALISLALSHSFWVSGCGPEDPEEVPDTPTTTPLVSPDIFIGDVTALEDPPGAIEVQYTLIGYQGLTLDLEATFSTDGLHFDDNQVTTLDDDDLTGKEASPEGSLHTVRWDSLDDLGYLSGSVWFRLTGAGDGWNIGPETVQIDIDNLKYDTPCLVRADPPLQVDGEIPITYYLMDDAGDECDVEIRVGAAGSESGEPATPSSTVASDDLENVDVPPAEEIIRSFVWDSLADIGSTDLDVVVTIRVVDENNEETASLELSVGNDPMPDPGELIFTEIMFQPARVWPYLEVYNVTQHPLDLSGIYLWSASQQATHEGTEEGYVVISEDEPLYIDLGDYVVLTQLRNEDSDLGDAVISGYGMTRWADTVELSTRAPDEEGDIIDSVSYNIDDASSPEVVNGHSFGLLPDYMSAGANNALNAWCSETSPIEGYEATDFGSPGRPTSCSATPATQ